MHSLYSESVYIGVCTRGNEREVHPLEGALTLKDNTRLPLFDCRGIRIHVSNFFLPGTVHALLPHMRVPL